MMYHRAMREHSDTARRADEINDAVDRKDRAHHSLPPGTPGEMVHRPDNRRWLTSVMPVTTAHMNPSYRLSLFIAALALTAPVHAQTPSVYAVAMQYAPVPGYQYFFSRIHSGTGTVEPIAELPVNAFYMGNAFMNFNGNYMFIGKDSTDNTFNLFEVDTLGAVLNAIPATNSAGNSTNLLCAFQSRKCPFYYGIRWESDALHELVKLDPVTGAATVMASALMPGQLSQSTYAMDGDDRLYFLEASGITGYKTLFRADPATGVITATDSMPAPEHLFNLFYDCETDKVFGFYKSDGDFSVMGSEWVEIDQNGSIVHTGTYLTAGGSFWISALTTLANGDYFQRNTGTSTIRFNAVDVGGASFAPATSTITGGDHKLYAAVPTSCGYTYDCGGHNSVNDIPGREEAWHLFPNPASDEVTMVTPATAAGGSYQLTDLAGRVLASGRIRVTRTVLDIQSLASGVYHVRIAVGESHRTLKLVK